MNADFLKKLAVALASLSAMTAHALEFEKHTMMEVFENVEDIELVLAKDVDLSNVEADHSSTELAPGCRLAYAFVNANGHKPERKDLTAETSFTSLKRTESYERGLLGLGSRTVERFTIYFKNTEDLDAVKEENSEITAKTNEENENAKKLDPKAVAKKPVLKPIVPDLALSCVAGKKARTREFPTVAKVNEQGVVTLKKLTLDLGTDDEENPFE